MKTDNTQNTPAPRVLFLIMSAQQSAQTDEQLVDTLAPHQVVIHHDYTKQPGFRIERPNAVFVPDPKVTGWGTWGFCEAMSHALRFCIDNFHFDYCQLLSPTCLPIRPIREFVNHVATGTADVHADLIDIGSNADVWMTYVHRAYLPHGTMRRRLTKHLVSWYFGRDETRLAQASLVVRQIESGANGTALAIKRKFALALVSAIATGLGAKHVYGPSFRPAVGSTWFGARRHVCEHLVSQSEDARLRQFFSRLSNIDEHLFPTLLHNSPFRIGPSNHAISPFDLNGHPIRLSSSGLAEVLETRCFFARKFPDEPGSAIRLRAIALAQPEKKATCAVIAA